MQDRTVDPAEALAADEHGSSRQLGLGTLPAGANTTGMKMQGSVKNSDAGNLFTGNGKLYQGQQQPGKDGGWV